LPLSPSTRYALEDLLRAFPEWAAFTTSGARDHEDPQALGDAYLEVSCPSNGARHVLAVRISAHTVEVSYSDGLPPGPAEQQFIAPSQDLTGATAEAVAFVRRLTYGQVGLVRHVPLFGRSQLTFEEPMAAVSGPGERVVWRERWR